MSIRNNQLAGTDWSKEGVSYDDLNDTFDAAQQESGLNFQNNCALIKTIDQDGTISLSEDSFENVVYESCIDDTKHDSSNSSNINFNSDANSIILNFDVDATPAETCDFTESSLPSGFSSETSNGTFTWDATNDEADEAISVSSSSGYSRMYSDTTYTEGVCVAAFRNIVLFSQNFESSGCYVKHGTSWVALYRPAVGGGGAYQWRDSEGNSVSYGGSPPTNAYLRLSVRKDGSMKSEYSTDGSSWTTLGDENTGGDTSDTEFKAGVEGSDSGTGTYNASASLFSYEIITDYESSGYYTRNTETFSSTVTGAILTDVDTDLPTNTSVSFSASADNGSNYSSITKNTVGVIANTGTQFKPRITLATSDNLDTPTVKFLGARVVF
jgi:hypothetical protein